MIKSTILASALMLCGPAGSMPNAVVLGGDGVHCPGYHVGGPSAYRTTATPH